MKKPKKTKRRVQHVRPKVIAKKRGRAQRHQESNKRRKEFFKKIQDDVGPKVMKVIEFFREHNLDPQQVANRLANEEGPWVFEGDGEELTLDAFTRHDVIQLLKASGTWPEQLILMP